jgi:hypothetical protein
MITRLAEFAVTSAPDLDDVDIGKERTLAHVGRDGAS